MGKIYKKLYAMGEEMGQESSMCKDGVGEGKDLKLKETKDQLERTVNSLA